MGEASTRFAALLDGHLEWIRLLNVIRLVCTSIASTTTSPNAFEKGASMMRRHVCDCSRGRVGDGCSFANQLVAQTRIHEKILFARTLPPVLSRHLRGWFCRHGLYFVCLLYGVQPVHRANILNAEPNAWSVPLGMNSVLFPDFPVYASVASGVFH